MRAISMCVGAVLFVIAAGAGAVNAQAPRGGAQAPSPRSTAAQHAAAPPMADPMFVVQAALANMAEIQLGHLAVEKAQREDVKDFAAQMIDDHIKAQNELLKAAMGAGIQWPKALDAKHAALKTRLSGLSGDAFDREYMKAMTDGHRDVEMMLAARASGTAPAGSANPDLHAKVTEWSAQTLPAVREHLKKAEQVSAQLQTSTR